MKKAEFSSIAQLMIGEVAISVHQFLPFSILWILFPSSLPNMGSKDKFQMRNKEVFSSSVKEAI